jgi:diaminohydroxyphosphoribosylaminopyrimidine deaminase / 5-amino-6-(5-phosphoribosylamino)uracil reductase
MQNYNKYMHRCIDLARNGKGAVAPNPMVGSVIVYKDQIVGEGYHMKYGGPHAEVNAIQSVKNKDLLSESTLYVSLEPCSHMGKTPPCSDLIIENKIKRVVVGVKDPNSLVAGRGIERLRNSGVEVVEGILEKECLELNKRFFTFHKLKRPYIILKWAQSQDGFIDIKREAGTPIGPNWISNPVSRALVHKWRSVEQAIMVGTNTIIYDNPRLNTRLWPGKSPVRIILDKKERINKMAHVYDKKNPTLVFSGLKRKSSENLEYIQVDIDDTNLAPLMLHLYERDLQSLMVEGGEKLLQSFIDQDLWDEARVFQGSHDFKDGIKAPEIHAPHKANKRILNDSLVIYYKQFE